MKFGIICCDEQDSSEKLFLQDAFFGDNVSGFWLFDIYLLLYLRGWQSMAQGTNLSCLFL